MPPPAAMPQTQADGGPDAGPPRERIKGPAALTAAVGGLVHDARRELRLFAPQLPPALCGGAAADALAHFFTRHPRNRLRLLIEDQAQVRRDHARLLGLARRAADGFELRVVDEADRGAGELYLVIDREAVLRQEDPERAEGYVERTRFEAARLAQCFDAAWERAQPTPTGTLGLAP